VTQAADAIPLRVTEQDLHGLLASSMEVMQQQARAADVGLSLKVDPALPRIHVDAEKIAWAVATLVGNALRHVRRGSRHLPGGTIEVRAGYDPATSEVALTVEDDGPGIPPAKLPSLFARGDGAPHATGLALLLIRDVVQAHGGRVEVSCRHDPFDHGTAIRLLFPVR
jgi:signal transduction histidine kinase